MLLVLELAHILGVGWLQNSVARLTRELDLLRGQRNDQQEDPSDNMVYSHAAVSVFINR